MRVVILSETRLWGGLEVHAVGLARTLAERGDHVSIACIGRETLELYRRNAPPGIVLVLVEPPVRRSVLGWWRGLRQIDADAVVLEKGTLATGGLALDVVLRARYRRFAAVMQLEPPVLPERTSRRYAWGLLPGLGLWWYRWKVAGWARSLAPSFTVCVSEAVRGRLISDYGFSDRKLVVVHNGVDASAFRPDPGRRARARAGWCLSGDALVFGSVGRLSDQKALDVAIQAFATVVAARPELPLYLVCVGEGAERRRLVELVRGLGLEHRVRLPGFTTDSASAYLGLDVFVIPSRHEGLPFALVEALASGCIVIGTTVGGIPEVITDSHLGFLVPPEDPDALAKAMFEVIGLSAERREAFARAGRQRVREAFDLRLQCLEIARLLDRAPES